MAETRTPPARRSDARLMFGDILVKSGVITAKQLQHALRLQAERPISLGRLLVETGMADEQAIVAALKRRCGITVRSLNEDIDGLLQAWRMRARGTRRLRIPFKLKLAVAIAVLVAVTVAGLSFVVLTRQRTQLHDQLIRTGQFSLNYIANSAGLPLLDEDVLRLSALVKEASPEEGVLYALIEDRKGIIRAHSNPARLNKRSGLPPPGRAAADEGPVRYEYRSKDGTHILDLSRPVTFRDKVLGTVHVGLSLDFIRERIEKETVLLAAISGIALLFAVRMGLRLAAGVSRPIGELVEATRQVSMGNLNHRIKRIRRDELGDLSQAFNFMADELLKKQLMHESFGKYVGSEVLELLLNDPDNTWLRGHRNEVTILFTDIRGFTSYSEERVPEALVEDLNQYFDIATRHIRAAHGYVDKFIGDAVMGVFGAPLPAEEHTLRAVRAALAMQAEFAVASREKGNPLLARVGIGINTGPVVAGNIGSQDKLEYTAIGDAVNVAARLNGLAGPGEIVVSETVYKALHHVLRAKRLGSQSVKGKSEPILTYRVLELMGSGAADAEEAHA